MMRVVVAPSLLPLVPRSATFDSAGEADEAAAALSGLGESEPTAWQTRPCCLPVAMDPGVLYQASELIHGKEPGNHGLGKGF